MTTGRDTALTPSSDEGIGPSAALWRAAVVGGTPLLREALMWWLETTGDFKASASFDDFDGLLARGGNPEYDVLVLDVRLCDDERLGLVRRAVPTMRLVLIGERLTPALTRHATAVRADGVVLTSDRAASVVDAVGQVMAGRVVYPARWQEHVVMVDYDPVETLSDRQRDVLALLAKGCSNEEIAQELCISRNTVKFHMREIFVRLGVRNRVEAAQRLATHAA